MDLIIKIRVVLIMKTSNIKIFFLLIINIIIQKIIIYYI